MKRIWDLCKVLENEHRRMLLAEIYASLDGGCNVGYLVDKMQGKLEAPAVTQYLQQLEQLGIVRRERRGRYVNYVDDMREAPAEVRDVARMIRAQINAHGKYDDRGMFKALMNAFRAKVARYLMFGGDGNKSAICSAFEHLPKHLVRDLQLAVDAGLLVEYADSYGFVTPHDAIVRRVIELAA